jgi:hypothetical protein
MTGLYSSLLLLVSASAGTDAGASGSASAIEAQGRPTRQCLARQTAGTKTPSFSFLAMVPSSEAADLTAKGFAPVACPGGGEDLTAYKARVCKLAEGNDAVQARTEEVLGVTATKLCGAARILAGEPATLAPPATSTPANGE